MNFMNFNKDLTFIFSIYQNLILSYLNYFNKILNFHKNDFNLNWKIIFLNFYFQDYIQKSKLQFFKKYSNLIIAS
jgi:hypothetical protein